MQYFEMLQSFSVRMNFANALLRAMKLQIVLTPFFLRPTDFCTKFLFNDLLNMYQLLSRKSLRLSKLDSQILYKSHVVRRNERHCSMLRLGCHGSVPKCHRIMKGSMWKKSKKVS